MSRAYVTNGLNQYTSSGGVSLGYDQRGNLTTSGTSTYTYDKLNDLTTAPAAGVSIYYDPLGRVAEYDTTASTRFFYSGGAPIAEVANPSGTVTQRYVPGASADEVAAWYQGSGNTNMPQFLQVDERGSVIAITNSTGGLVGTNSYDEFGIPASTNICRIGYTGQTWFPEAGLYNYKARWYSPSLGRFMQSDPIGYRDGLNWYSYAHGDPISWTDPSGTEVIGAVVGGVFGFTEGFVGQVIADGGQIKLGQDFTTAAINGLGGAAVGALDPTAGIATIAFSGALIGGASDLVAQKINGRINGQKLNYGEVVGAAVGGAVAGGLGQGFNKLAGNIIDRVGQIAFAIASNEVTAPFVVLTPLAGAEVDNDVNQIVVTGHRAGSNKPTTVTVPNLTSGSPGIAGIGNISAGTTGIPDFSIPIDGYSPLPGQVICCEVSFPDDEG